MPSSGSIIASPASPSPEQSSDGTPVRRKSRVSAEHTLTRVRENQRRHRARQRDHVATLEQKLADTERLLAEARAEIATLRAETEAANAICRYSQLRAPESSSFSNKNVTDIVEDERSAYKQNELEFIQPSSDYPDVQTQDLSFLAGPISPAISIALNNPPPTDSDSYSIGPPPCCSDLLSSPPPDEPVDPECSTCKTRPAPDPSESTTLCAQAYVMISQQNFMNLEPETIRLWLAQGLRRAQREGEGCRVENGALLGLLDYISGM